MTFSVFNSLKPVSAKWDALLLQDHPLHSQHLLVLEQAASSDLEFRYVFFYNAGIDKPVAVAYFQLVQFKSLHYQGPLMNNFLLRPLEKWLMKKGFRILICGNLFRIDAPGVYFDQAVISASDLMISIEKFYQGLVPGPHAILIKDWQQEWSQEWVTRFAFQVWPNDLTMKMRIREDWASFQDYISSLKHRYAQRARRARKKFVNVQRRELPLQEIIRYGDELETLYLNVVEKQFIRMVIVNKDYFIKMKETYGDKFLLLGYFRDDKLIAFSTNLVHDHVWELHYVGMDYAYNEELWLYFNILFDSVSDAISSNKQELELGRTAREAKTIVGCEPVYFQSFVRLNGSLVNWLVRRFTGRFNIKAGMPVQSRHPFKHQE